MSIRCLPAESESLEAAARLLAEGKLAVLPTDTVYGICADVRRDEAVRAIQAAKGRSEPQPLQWLFDSVSRMDGYAVLTDWARRLFGALGACGLTVICPAAPGWSSPALAGGRTVGVRWPDASVVQEVVALLGAPLAASSANRHGGASPATCAEAVRQVGTACAVAIDGGRLGGLDSTVVDCSADVPRILREGAVDRETVARILGLREIAVLRSVRR